MYSATYSIKKQKNVSFNFTLLLNLRMDIDSNNKIYIIKKLHLENFQPFIEQNLLFVV